MTAMSLKRLLISLVLIGLTGFSILAFSSAPVAAQGQDIGDAIGDAVTPPAATSSCNDSLLNPASSCTLAQRIADPSGFVYQAWRITRSIINVLLIIALLLISFSNITRISIDTYTIKKALPNLVIGVILANASFLIVKYMADLSTVVTYFFVEQTTYTTFKDFIAGVLTLLGITSLETIGPVFFASSGGVLVPILVLIMSIVATVGILWMAFLFYFRLVAIYLLTILAPLAFVAYGIPGFDKYFKQWWQQFIKWLFILPAMSAVLWLIFVIGNAGGTNQSVARTLILYVLFFTALTLPSKMGGAIIDKASKAFSKYSGVNAGLNATKDYASLKGQQAYLRLPGVARYQAWREMNNANAKKDIELLKKGGKAKMMRGAVGKYTARNAGKLDLLDKEISANEAAAKAIAEVAAAEKYNLSERVNVAEFKKKLAEERKGAHENEKKLDLLMSPDKKAKDLIKEINMALIDNEVLTKEVGRAEGMAKGSQATEYLQPVQAAQNWKRLKEEYDHLNPAQQAGAYGQELQSKMNKINTSYTKMRTDKTYSAQYGNLTIDQLVQKIGDKNSKEGRLLDGRQRQTARMFNEGIAGQIETDVKEQTVKEIEREMNEYIEYTLREKLQAANPNANAGQINQLVQQAQKDFFDGDTAALYSAGINAGDVRSGVVIAEKYKSILRSTNDIRHGDALESFINLQNTYASNTFAVPAGGLAGANQQVRRQAAGQVAQQSGILARQANYRNQNAVPQPPTQAAAPAGQGGGQPGGNPPVGGGGGQPGANPPAGGGNTPNPNIAPPAGGPTPPTGQGGGGGQPGGPPPPPGNVTTGQPPNNQNNPNTPEEEEDFGDEQ